MSTLMNQYLSTRGYIIWPGVVFNLTDPKECAKAEQWYRDFQRDYNEYVDAQSKTHSPLV